MTLSEKLLNDVFVLPKKYIPPKRCNNCYFVFEHHSHIGGWYLQCQGFMSHYYGQETYKEAEHCHLFINKERKND